MYTRSQKIPQHLNLIFMRKITKLDGETVRTNADLSNLLTYYKAGTTVTLTVQSLQDGAYVERQVQVTLKNRPQEVEKQ